MKKNLLFKSLLLVVFVALVSYFVMGSLLYVPNVQGAYGNGTVLANNANISGLLILNATNLTSGKVNGTQNNHIMNTTFFWINITGLVYNTTVFNTTANQSTGFVNGSFNTALLGDGKYWLAVNWTNRSGSTNGTTVVTNIMIDNTVPTVTSVAPVTNLEYKASSGVGGNLTFTATVNDLSSNVSNVSFSFDNSTYKGFNVSGINSSGVWNISYNLSGLGAGSHVVTIFAFDWASNLNRSETITFTLNDAPNVTIFTAPSSSYFNYTSGNQTFNISVINNTGTIGTIDTVILMFDNASGGINFNKTVMGKSVSPGYIGGGNLRLFNFTYNVSSLFAGSHTITVFANDSKGNWNRTETITFTINTPPNVSVITSPNGSNFTLAGGNSQIFNISVKNSTDVYGIDMVILMFDNASGTDFNVTTTLSSLTGADTSNRYANASYNVSKLGEGVNTVTIFVNDTLGNWNRTETIRFTTDYTAPAITLTRDSTSTTSKLVIGIATGSDVSGSCTTNLGGITDTGSTQTLTYTGLEAGKSYTFVLSCTDFAGNTGGNTESFTTDAAAASGGGAGGSGGGQSSSTIGNFKQETWSSLLSGEAATVDVPNSAIGVTQVNFDVSDTVYGAWVRVTKTDSLPTGFKKFVGKVYKTVEMTKSATLKSELIKNVEIKFKVQKAWLSANGLEKGDLTLYRYVEDEWHQLSSVIGEDDGTYLHYTAESPGFSYFVIGEKGVPMEGGATVGELVDETISDEPVVEIPVEEPVATEEANLGGVGFVVVVVLVALGVVALVVFLKRRR